MEGVSEYGVLKPLFRGQAIQRDLIVRCWDDMHRISASLKDGTVMAVLLVAKLQALEISSAGLIGRITAKPEGNSDLPVIHRPRNATVL